ncbi:GntR family phosphonate transport system transcriptional regulator [Maritalea mobilis]|uniref:GntR family phosphonate transport system transcriptional regulator n=1 Tax=Maritalea mobilis TaxID=483324 RepID=A0A4R6VSZ1_9HYPH|nr:phosphonate metabolism transcriptional regulator PhnF [Maritalea mobilis]TDQ67193.1 GntR family phosphonate transport system transcriptional regulator [Maritalea mobilis]
MADSKWILVRNAIDSEIKAGQLKPGARLPTEPDLCAKFDAGRHSVRRAIAALSIEGKVRTQQGSGTYVETPELIKYVIGRRTRFRQNLREQGLAPGGKMLGHSVGKADEKVAQALGIKPGDQVIRIERLTTADNVPIAYGTAYKPYDRFPDYIHRRAQHKSVTDTYKSYGIEDYVRADTTVYTRQPRTAEAHALAQHPQMPVMVVSSIDALLDGTPISYSQVAWAGARVRFSLEAEPEDFPIPLEMERQNG